MCCIRKKVRHPYRYDLSTREEVIRLLVDEGCTYDGVAAKVNVTSVTAWRWHKQYKQAEHEINSYLARTTAQV